MRPEKTEQPNTGRRRLLPLLVGGLALPWVGWAKSQKDSTPPPDAPEDLVPMLRQDGTVVQVPRKSLEKAQVVGRRISNKTLLGWLAAGKPK